ncbi:DUF1801 domain-containing protein [Flavobacterium proteolyticum]|uniref:DUF1801 domain-containing protein n=1 Tax=Flavobacterium proteolyticum TaxID=2911683 RepID=A0ABR9WSI9_9FLAO|nr:DUF1801 domain-containing protein [Flavobacterium proteolyticum]MBE9576832.1 DUF1801 domain-containing protein [Flavobacterium proteolyticum]
MKPTEVYILRQPEHYQVMMLHVISVVERELSSSELLFKWGIPYLYYKKKPFCYLAPNHKRGFLDVGFAKGFELKRNQEVLVDENRNTVKSLRYYSIGEIDNAILIDVVLEAKLLYK